MVVLEVEEDSEEVLGVVLEVDSGEGVDLEIILECDMNTVLCIIIINEFSLFKLSKINGCLHRADMRT